MQRPLKEDVQEVHQWPEARGCKDLLPSEAYLFLSQEQWKPLKNFRGGSVRQDWFHFCRTSLWLPCGEWVYRGSRQTAEGLARAQARYDLAKWWCIEKWTWFRCR